MAGLKSLFRRKSRGKSISGERPDLSDAPPSPARASQPDSSPRNTTSIQSQSVNNASARSTTPTPRTNRASMPQDPSLLVDRGATPYDAMPSGRAPEKGNYAIHGNGSAGAPPYDSAPTQSRSRAVSGANSTNRPTGAQTPNRRSVGAGTGTAMDQSSGQRSQSRASAYTDTSRYTEDATGQRYEDIPPVPKPYEGPTDANKKLNTRIPPVSGAQGYASNISTGARDASHRRDISTTSVGSTPKTPIADEFSTSAWYKQRGSPPIPEFSQANPPQRNANYRESTAQSGVASKLDNRSTTAETTPSRTAGQYQPPSRSQYQAPDVMGRSAALGRATESGGNTQRQATDLEQQTGNSLGSAYGDSSSKGRLASVPKRSLDKPLPVPTEVSQPTAPNNDDGRGPAYQTLPMRETGRTQQVTNDTAAYKSANGSSGATQSPVTPRQQKAVPVSSMDSPSSPVRSGKYTRNGPQSSGNTEIRSGPQQIYQRPYIVTHAAKTPSLQGVVDLNNSVDTSTHVRYADAVLHETVIPSVHHIREERITREIHNYHIYHRILPVIDVQVLPTKHIVRSSNAADGEYIEIPEELVPGREHRNWVIAETVSKIPGELDPATQRPRKFTARTFGATEGDYKEYINEKGVPTTETWWVHPPTFETGAYFAGQTLPLEFH